MRNKARLSITGSTGENGRVMTPEFPKAVHAVPYVRPDMGLNVSLTDLSWLMRNFWVPYNGFIIAIFFFLSRHFFCLCLVIKEKVEDGFFILSPTMKCIVTFTHYCSLYNSPPPLGGITSRRKKERNFFFFCEYTTLSYLTYWTGLRRKRGLYWRQTPAPGSQSFTSHLYLRVCLCERERECVCGCLCACAWVLRARCHLKHTVSVGTAAKQDFQAHLISSA